VPRGSAHARGYDHRWQVARERFLSREENLFCKRCEAEGKTIAATIVDHVVPHRGNRTLFWDETNWQALCKPCHDRKTATEDGGFGREKNSRPTSLSHER
jgi:5-methylcytosine-specific restriction protein A